MEARRGAGLEGTHDAAEENGHTERDEEEDWPRVRSGLIQEYHRVEKAEESVAGL